MASLSFGTDDPLTTKRWARKVEREMLPATLLGLLGGRGGTAAFTVKDDLAKGAGDRIRIPYLRLLSDEVGLPLPPIEGQVSPEGRERAQQYQSDDVEIDMTSQAVRFWRVISDQRTEFSARDDAKETLKKWWADYCDVVALYHAAGFTPAPSFFNFHNAITGVDADHIVRANDLATDEAVGGDTTATMTTDVLDDMIYTAETQTERGNPAMERCSLFGGQHWAIIMSHKQHFDMLQDPDSVEKLELAAMQGGEIEKNTLRTLYRGKNVKFIQYYRDAALFASYRIPKGVNSGDPALAVDDTRRAVLLGAMGLWGAFGRQTPGKERFAWTEWNFPYNREMGVDAMLIGGMKASVIGGKRLATVVGTTYAEEVT